MDSWSFLPLLPGDGGWRPRTEVLLQGGSGNELIYRQDPWKLIVQSNHKLTQFEPAALFNLVQNPTENEADNLIDHPDHKDRVAAMLNRYLEIRNGGLRTAPPGI